MPIYSDNSLEVNNASLLNGYRLDFIGKAYLYSINCFVTAVPNKTSFRSNILRHLPSIGITSPMEKSLTCKNPFWYFKGVLTFHVLPCSDGSQILHPFYPYKPHFYTNTYIAFVFLKLLMSFFWRSIASAPWSNHNYPSLPLPLVLFKLLCNLILIHYL